MADFSNLLAIIAANIYQNGNNEVTANMVKTPLDDIVLAMQDEFNGIESRDGNSLVFAVAGTPNTYQNIGQISGEFIITDTDVAFNGAIYGNSNGTRSVITSLPTIGQKVVIPSGYDYIEVFSRSTNTATNFDLRLTASDGVEFQAQVLVNGTYRMTHPGGANTRYTIYDLPAGWYDISALWSGAGANLTLACYNGATLVKAFTIVAGDQAAKFIYIDGFGYDTITINTTSANAATAFDVTLTARASVREVIKRSNEVQFVGDVCWKKKFSTGAKVVVAGDSISVGYIGGGSFVPVNWPDRIAAEFGGVVKNYGVGGATLYPVSGYSDVLTQLQSAKAAGDLDDCEAVIIYAGTNDYSYANDPDDVASTVSAINAYLSANLGAAGARVYFVTPINRTDPPAVIGGEVISAYRSAIARAAILGGNNVIDGGLAPFPEAPGTYATAVLTDGIHPTAVGYDILSNFICGKIL